MIRVLDRTTARNDKRLEKLRISREQLASVDEAQLLENGLSSKQIVERQTLGLTNQQHNDASRSLGAILRANLFTLFNLLVGTCFLVLIILGQFKDALFGMVVILNILIGIIQEYRSKRALDKLAVLHAATARVRRDGRTSEIKVDDLLLDDLLELRAGDQVLADAIVCHSSALELDESMLTGESDAVHKVAGDDLLAGSGVAGGSGLARVVRIGAETYASQITLEARRFSLVSSELRNSLARLVKWISIALPPIVVLVINGQMMAHGGWQESIESGAWLDALVRSIAAIISMIPQGLVLLTSIAFAVSAMKLTRQKVLVQELAAVEGLARVDVVCFDKTGTLTEGEIEFAGLVKLMPDNSKDAPSQEIEAVLAHFGDDPNANTTARCLKGNFRSVGLSTTASVAFNSERKWSAFSFDKTKLTTWVLGAPELVLADKSKEHQFALGESAGLAASGKRTLVLAATKSDLGKHETLPKKLVPVALVTFKERVRSDAAETLDYFKSQGVSIRIISGDNPRTVAAVAKDAGFAEAGEGFDARELPTEQYELAEVLEKNFVFGRVTPEQKRNMVIALQSRGHVVAMTGDGVNDALALKKADMGIAMGSGAAATKAVSNLVLLDGKFSNLPGVVAEGRRVIANIERVSRLFLTKTAWAMTLSIVFGLFLWEFPFLPRQLSVVDAYTIGIPAFALALLPNPRRYLPGFLRRALSFTVPAGLLVGIGVIVQDRMIVDFWSVSEMQTATSILLSMTGMWVLAALARPLNGLKVAIVASMAAIGITAFSLKPVVEFFDFAFLPIDRLLLPIIIGAICCAGIEIVHRSVAKITR